MADATPSSTGPLSPLRAVGPLIRAIHARVVVTRTVHVLPFAAIGAALAERGWPPLGTTVLLVIAIVFGRATAVGLLRFFEAPPDVTNPVPPPEGLPPSPPPPRPVWLVFAVHGAAVLIFVSFMINRTTGYLSLPYVALLVLYAGTRRYTGISHVLLGLGLASTPAAAWVAYRGTVDGALIGFAWFGAGITAWVAGFDMLYSLRPSVREGVGPGMFSRPMRLSVPRVLKLARFSQGLAVLLFATLPLFFALSPLYLIGPTAAGALIALSQRRLDIGTWVVPRRGFVELNLLTGPALLLGVVVGLALGR